MLLSYARFAACALSATSFQSAVGHTTGDRYKTELIYQFPTSTVIENLAVRPDGSILSTIANRAEVYLIQPSTKNPNPKLIYQFPGSNAATGIVETSADVFYVTVTNVTANLSPVPNTSKLYKLAFPGQDSHKPAVSKVADLPRVLVPNGLTALASGKRLLSADSPDGSVAILDTATGATLAAFYDPLFNPVGNGTFGVNGVEIKDSTLFFTNSAQKLFAKIPIDPLTGFPTGATATKIANTLSPAGTYDDFAINPNGDAAFVATSVAN